MPLRQEDIQPVVNKGLIGALRRTMSPARLQPYLEACGYSDDRAIKLYLWNVVIGQSFHFPLQAVEVSLRNVVNEALCQVAGNGWWAHPTAKYLLDDKRLADLGDLQTRLNRRGLKITTDEIVAGLSFGFWVAVLAPKYKQDIWNKHQIDAFPNLPRDTDQRAIYVRANKALNLRNAIFHHEPLIARDLSGCYSAMMQLLNWVCPETQKWVKAHCSVPRVLREKP